MGENNGSSNTTNNARTVRNTEYVDSTLLRRRFYLSKNSLEYLDLLALQHKVSASILLDSILLRLANS